LSKYYKLFLITKVINVSSYVSCVVIIRTTLEIRDSYPFLCVILCIQCKLTWTLIASRFSFHVVFNVICLYILYRNKYIYLTWFKILEIENMAVKIIQSHVTGHDRQTAAQTKWCIISRHPFETIVARQYLY